MTKEEIIVKFIEFLKENDCYDNYLKNFEFDDQDISLDEFFSLTHGNDFISGAFHWDNPKNERSIAFWSALSSEWSQLLTRINMIEREYVFYSPKLDEIVIAALRRGVDLNLSCNLVLIGEV